MAPARVHARRVPALLEPRFSRVEMLGVFHARKLRVHELALRLGWDRVHPALRLTKPFYDRIRARDLASDFDLRDDRARAGAGLPGRLPCLTAGRCRAGGTMATDAWSIVAARCRTAVRHGEDAVGDLAIVLHSHMPYVEGFGTYPFGEEWLFDAVARSYLPVLEVARDLTMTVTPGARRPARGAGRAPSAWRPSCAATGSRPPSATRPEARRSSGQPPQAEAERYRARARAAAISSTATCSRRSGPRPRSGTSRWCPRRPRTRCCRWSPRPPAGACRSTPGCARTGAGSAAPAGFWLPECAYRPGLEPLLAERGPGLLLHRPERPEAPLDALAPCEAAAGLVAFTLDWRAVELVWSQAATRPTPHTPSSTAIAARESASGRSAGGPTIREAAAGCAEQHARRVRGRGRARGLRPFASERGRPGLVTFAIDTELLGHWWSEGPAWLEAVLRRGARARGAAASPCRRRWSATRRGASPAGIDLGRGQGPSHLGLARGRRPRLGGAAARAAPAAGARRRPRRPPPPSGRARELLAVQASDWAFLDRRRQAGDYPYQRSTAHARALLEAMHAAEPPDPRLRNLAPDLSLAPLLEP